ncbi:MAG: hypothetical protein PHS54_01495 [Clostridia bacterium]|nr:hypothetical protein [Clostridia bacterium]
MENIQENLPISQDSGATNPNENVKNIEDKKQESNIENKTILEDKKEPKKLKPAEELFCQLYAGSSEYFNNASMSYVVAYDKKLDEIEDEKERARVLRNCRSMGSNMLTKLYIRERVSEILRENLTNNKIDEEISWVAKQRKDLSSKMRAISEYNKLKGRIEEKIKHSLETENLLTKEQIERLFQNRNIKENGEAKN